MMAKINVPTPNDREEIKRLIDIFRGNIVDLDEKNYTVEMTGPADKLDAFIKAINTGKIVEVVRSGVLGIARGGKHLSL